MYKKVIIIGAGGHAKVISDIILKSNDEVIGFLDDNIEIGTIIVKENELKVIGKVEQILEFDKEDNIEFIIGIGNNEIRKKISNDYKVNYYTAVHPTAVIGSDVNIGIGTVVMPNVCINVSTKIGKHCIINTGAIVEHDNAVGDFVHVSPNATLAGTVSVGQNSHIGAGAIVKNNISICNEVVIGAGAVVVKDIIDKGIYIGVPAKKIK